MIAESQYAHKIETLTNNYKKFTKFGSLGSNIKNGKICKNVSNTFMFNNNIPMEQVRNKPMHFSLIFKDIFYI